jgi:peptidylprolyl isomerase
VKSTLQEFREILVMSERVVLAPHEPDGKLGAVRAPRLVSWSLFVLLLPLPVLGLAGCGKTGAVVPRTRAPDAGPPAPIGAPMPDLSGPGSTPVPPDVFAPPADAEHEPNGAARKILARGTGTTHPPADSFVELHYAGWERNGRQFEGTPTGQRPGRFELASLAPGLAAELAQMVEGDKRRIWLPAALAYGKRENFVNAPKGDMTFEVELVRIIPVPPVPPDVKAAPKDAKATKSGLKYVVLKKGTGKRHPVESSHTTVIYTAWQPNGHMFQTSLAVGDDMRVLVNKLPSGWREAMQLMVEGDKWRLWLPGKLAFGDLPPGEEPVPFGPPAGPVVFDVELVKIIE